MYIQRYKLSRHMRAFLYQLVRRQWICKGSINYHTWWCTVLYRTWERLKPGTRGQDCCPQADVGENGEYSHCGSALGGEVPQGLYRSPVVEGTRASSVK